MAQEAKPSNGHDMGRINGLLDRMQGIEDECSSIMGKAMQECKSLREDQKDIKAEAKSLGVRSKVFNELWSARKALDKSEAALTSLDGDDRAQIEEILSQARDVSGFGDTPFGAHLISVFENA